MKRLLFSFVLLYFATSISIVSAQSEGSSIKAQFLVEGGIEYGGDELLEVMFTNGGEQTIKAGQGGSVGAGGQLEFRDLPSLLLRSTLSYKFVTTAADDAKIRFTRIPFHLSAFYKFGGDFRVGAGATTHFNPKLNGDGYLPDQTFESSVSPRFEVGYKWIAVMYTPLKYTAATDGEYSGNALGVFLSFSFPR